MYTEDDIVTRCIYIIDNKNYNRDDKKKKKIQITNL